MKGGIFLLDEIDTTKFEDSDGIETYYCPNCRANLRFDIRSQSLKCDFCGTEVGVESNGTVDEYDFSNLELLEKQSNWNTEAIAFQCESCGAELITESHETATRCPYCDSSHVIQHQQFSGMRPEGIIPFRVAKDGANSLFSNWVSNQWLAPNNFKQAYLGMELCGIYIPYWTYDASVCSHYVGEGGVDAGESTIWHPTSGYINHDFDDVLVCASTGLDKTMVKNIEPFNTKQALSYRSEYLSGFKAERYVVDAKEGYNLAKEQMVDVLREIASEEIKKKYERAIIEELESTYSHVHFKHLLLPVWVLTYTYKNKIYHCLINGESGKINGRAPVSPWKMTILIISIILATLVFCFLFAFVKVMIQRTFAGY